MTARRASPIVFAASGASHLVEGLRRCDVDVQETRLRRFPDGEVCASLPDEVDHTDVVIIQGTQPPQHEHLVELYQLVEAASGHGARSIRCIVPYLAYARQDRRTRSGEPLSALVVLRTLAALGADEISVVDVHNPAVLQACPVPAQDLSVVDRFATVVRGWAGDRSPLVVSPDRGGAARAERLARAVGTTAAVLTKRKDDSGATWYVAGDGGAESWRDRDVVVVDDLCSTGSTLVPLAERLRDGGAGRLLFAIVHLFADRAVLQVKLGADVAVVGTDTTGPWEGTVSVAPELARAIRSTAVRPRSGR